MRSGDMFVNDSEVDIFIVEGAQCKPCVLNVTSSRTSILILPAEVTWPKKRGWKKYTYVEKDD